MRKLLLILLLATQCVAATSYYVSPTGLDSNSGTSLATPWLTLAHVNAHSFSPGDTIYLQRGGTWSEPLIPPSSGTSGNPISFDAYGVGPAPVITGAAPALTWTYNSGNIWSAQLPAAPASATVLNMEFGSLWGQYKAPNTTCLSAGVIVSARDFCSYSGYVYVYDSSPTNAPAAFYGTTITPILTVASGYQLINISSKKWLTFQHLNLQNFDQQGVLIWSASDNLVFANMEVDGQVPYGTTPLGIYINATSPASIKFYNVDGHLNYDAWKIAGTAGSTSAIALVNCSAFGNRDAAIVDNVAGGSTVVTYSHFYGNGLSTLWAQDVQGVAGPNVSSTTNIGTPVNISLNFASGIVPNYVDPQIASYGQYAAWETFTVDDVGLALAATGSDGILYPNSETYINSNVLPAFNLYGLKFNAAVTTGYSSAQGYAQAVDTASVTNWFNQGHGINSHSWSHQYFTPAANLNAFTLLYNGTGTASISGNFLTTSVTGGTGSNLNLDLTVAPYNEVKSLVSYLNTRPGYTAVKSTVRDVTHAVGLADVAAQPISGSALQFVFDTQRMETDEMTTSMAWLNANIPGLTETFYVTPDGQENTATQGYALAAGYTGERGELSMGGALGASFGSNEVASKGVGLMNIVSLGMAAWNTSTAAQMDAGTNCLVFRQKLWGYPVGLFIHMPDLTGSQILQTLAGLTNHGATVKLNTQLRDWMLSSWTVIPNTTPAAAYYQLPQPGAAFSAVRTAMSPDVGAGQNLGAPYDYDINGVRRTEAWDIGAYQRVNVILGGGTGSGYFVVGNPACGPPNYCARTDPAAVTLPAVPPQAGLNICTAGILNQCGNSTGAGRSFTDPNFSSTVYRVSDVNTNQPSNQNYTVEVTPTGSGEEQAFNCNSTMIVVGNSGGAYYPMNFNPPTFSRMYTTTDSATNGLVLPGTSMGWGRVCPTDAGLLYMLNGTILQSYNLAGNTPSGAPPDATNVFDYSTCSGLPGGLTWSAVGGGSADDNDWAAAFSTNGQDGSGAIYVVVFRNGSNCRMLNLSSDVVSGSWGPTGTIPGTPCLSSVHNVKIFKYGGELGAVRITPSGTTCGNTEAWVWVYGAASLAGSLFAACTVPQCGGHQANGLLTVLSNPGNSLPNYLSVCQINGGCPSTNGITAALPTGLAGTIDAHFGWNSLNDTFPLCASTYLATPGTPTIAYQNEIVCIPPYSGPNWWRFASTFNTGANPDFCTLIACGAVSQDGKWFMWTSDWQDTLGATNGAATCTPGSSGNCRGDVFAVKLR